MVDSSANMHIGAEVRKSGIQHSITAAAGERHSSKAHSGKTTWMRRASGKLLAACVLILWLHMTVKVRAAAPDCPS